MAPMISHHRTGNKGKFNGVDRVSEYIYTYKSHRNHKFILWLLQNLMMMYQMRILRLLIPHCHQLNKGIDPEDPKDLDHVCEYLHVHPRIPASSHNLLYLLPEFSRPRLWQLRAKMMMQQLWIHKIA